MPHTADKLETLLDAAREASYLKTHADFHNRPLDFVVANPVWLHGLVETTQRAFPAFISEETAKRPLSLGGADLIFSNDVPHGEVYAVYKDIR